MLRQLVLDFRLIDVSNRTAALQATCKGRNAAPEVERLDDLLKLAVRFHRANGVRVRYRISLEKPAIAREHDPLLIASTEGDGSVVQITLIDGIETKEPQVARELSQMHVRNEFRIAERLGTKPSDTRNVQPLEHRVDGHALATGEAMLETDGLPVHEDDVDLGMRHAERFDKVLDRTRSAQAVVEATFPPMAGKKIIELLVEPKLDLFVSKHAWSP